MSLTVALLLVIAAPAAADEPRCEPLAVGVKATLEEAAMSIATCPVEHVLVLMDGEATHHTIGTETAAVFPRPESRKAIAVHNHTSASTAWADPGIADACAAMKVRKLYLVTTEGIVERVKSYYNPMHCMKLQHAAKSRAAG